MKTALRRKLNRLWLLELAAAVILVIAYVLFRMVWGAQTFGNYTLLALATLCFILFLGSSYWWLKLRQLDDPRRSLDPRMVQIAFAVAMLLLLAYPSALLIAILNGTAHESLIDVVIGGGLYLFALAEFVHYFLVKIVRSDSDRQALKRRRQVSARIMRELQRSEVRKGTR